MEAKWMIVELLGHRTLPGLVDEVERFGVKLGRVRVPGLRAEDPCLECEGKGRTYVGSVYDADLESYVREERECETCRGTGKVAVADPEWIGEQEFSPSALYGLTPCTEAYARTQARRLTGLRHAALAGRGPNLMLAEAPTSGGDPKTPF